MKALRLLFVGIVLACSLALPSVPPASAGQVARPDGSGGYEPCSCICYVLFGYRYCICICGE